MLTDNGLPEGSEFTIEHGERNVLARFDQPDGVCHVAGRAGRYVCTCGAPACPHVGIVRVCVDGEGPP